MPVGVVQAAAPKRETVRQPCPRHNTVRAQAVQGQVEAEQRRVPRPCRLAIRTLEKSIVRNDALQHFAEGG